MLYYKVEVFPQRVVINEVKSLRMYDVKARVDGDDWLYRIVRSKWQPPKDKGWFGRGLNNVYYHAKNSGDHVTFVPVHRVKRQRTIKRHPNQRELF